MTGVIVAGLADRHTATHLVLTVAKGAKRCFTIATADHRTDAALTAIGGGADGVLFFTVSRIATFTCSPVGIIIVRPFGTPIVP